MASYTGVIAPWRNLLVRSILAVACLACGVVHALAVAEIFRSPNARPELGWSMALDDQDRLTVTAVDAGGPATQLRAGDRVLAVAGFPPLRHGLGGVAFMDLRDGDTYFVRVVRGEQTLDLRLVYREMADALSRWLIQIPLLLIAIAFLVSGAATGWLRPQEPVARLYAALAILVAIALIPFGVFAGDYGDATARAVFAMARATSPVMLSVGYQFFKAFPPGIPIGLGWRWLGAALFAWSTLLLPGALGTAFALGGSAARGVRLLDQWRSLVEVQDLLSTFFILAALGSSAAVVVRNHLVVSDPDQRRRLRWVMWGSLAGTLPMFGAFGWSVGVELVTGHAPALATWLRVQASAALFMVFLPVTFAYAVIRHRVIGIDVVIRKSAQYLLARNVLRAAVALPIVALSARTLLNPDQTVAALIFGQPSYLLLAGASAIVLLVRTRLSQLLDRRFFREAADRDRILLDLIARIGEAQDQPDDVARLVRDGVSRALHPQMIELWVPASEGAMSRLADEPGDTRLAGDAPPATLLRRIQGTSGFDRSVAPTVLLPEEALWFAQHPAQLLIPIGSGAHRVTGWLLLGEKKSETPYTGDERRLLKGVSDQVAIVWDNAALRSQVASAEHQRHQVLARMDAAINLFKECPQCGRCYDRSQSVCDFDGAVVSHTLGIERIIQDRYRLDAAIGRGGVGVVYAATDLRLGRTVAVKLLKNPAGDSVEARRRFDLEARALARLSHPNIVTIHDYGTVGVEIAFLVMEYLQGSTLRLELRRAGKMPPAAIAIWLAPVFDAIAYAHEAGVIHRDLKPENVFFAVDAAGVTPKVLDFGLAKLTGAEAVTSIGLTDPGHVMGTLAYMSPEQATGQAVDSRTDVFALGVIVLEALTGGHPFLTADPLATLAAVLQTSVGVSGDAVEIAALDGVIQRAVAKSAAGRYAGVQQMAEAVLPALRRCPDGSSVRLMRQ